MSRDIRPRFDKVYVRKRSTAHKCSTAHEFTAEHPKDSAEGAKIW